MSTPIVYEMRAPRQDRCSLCQSKEGPFHFEDRYTGKNLALQRWPYCHQCWFNRILLDEEPKKAQNAGNDPGIGPEPFP
jgi:hypothetical protein